MLISPELSFIRGTSFWFILFLMETQINKLINYILNYTCLHFSVFSLFHTILICHLLTLSFFPIIFAFINPAKILLKADCLPCLPLLPNCFTKQNFTALPNSTFSTSSLSFASPALPYLGVIWSQLFSPWTLHHLQEWPELSTPCCLLKTSAEANCPTKLRSP